MRRRTALFMLTTTATAWCVVPAHAQVDIDPPAPNIMIILDTSGSMEDTVEGNTPTCTSSVGDEQNRWAIVVQALTGTIPDFSCNALDRSSSSFHSIYGDDIDELYDLYYETDHHRIQSNGCYTRPNFGAISGGSAQRWWSFPDDAIDYYDGSGSCSFFQNRDGIIDQYGDRVRFGLMTFDSLPDNNDGRSGNNYDIDGGYEGHWSYWFNGGGEWSTGSQNGTMEGGPAGCSTLVDFEVGVRSPTALPWEGKMMPFGDADRDFDLTIENNDRIQEVILSTRPYGGTPLAAAFDDVRAFIRDDDTNANMPGTSDSEDYGPRSDPYFTDPQQCRQQHILLITDGSPDLDLRPECYTSSTSESSSCTTASGCCPYPDLPYEVAEDLWTNEGVRTYVVAVAMEDVNITSPGPQNGSMVDCAVDLNCSNAFGANNVCEHDSTGRAYLYPEMAGCCNALEIACSSAANATEGDAQIVFASNIDDITAALDTMVASVVGSPSTRTHPVFAQVINRAAAPTTGTVGFQVLSSITPSLGADPWSGNIQRARYVCAQPDPTELDDITISEGDDFAEILKLQVADRQYFTVNPEDDSGNRYPERSIRPHLASIDDDGLGTYGGTQTSLSTLGTFMGAVDPASMGIPSGGCSSPDTNSDTSCRTAVLEWYAGVAPSVDPEFPQRTSPLGGIYHSTPALVTPPRAFFRDQTYAAYADAQALRPTMLYTATTDGFVHAFKVAANDSSDPVRVNGTGQPNELWNFIPPAVLGQMRSNYRRKSILTDGRVVVMDIPGDVDMGGTPTYGRSLSQAQNSSQGWRRVMVAGSGKTVHQSGYYYAVDITDLDEPIFLWQLSTDEAGEPLFGAATATPAIAIVNFEDSGNNRLEVPVAVLAGGEGERQPGSCTRQNNWNYPAAATVDGDVRCWDDDPADHASGRSLILARLDTGEIIQSFWADEDEAPSSFSVCTGSCNSNDRGIEVEWDSPIVGEPVVYPPPPATASRIYVGDADGTVWRVNVSDLNKGDWEVYPFWDAYEFDNQNADDREPVNIAPSVSVSLAGAPLVIFATGDQTNLDGDDDDINYIWAVEDSAGSHASGFEPSPRWHVELEEGERVSGPISVFDETAYFATFVPNNDEACELGYGKIWGLDYYENTSTPENYTPIGLWDGDSQPEWGCADPDGSEAADCAGGEGAIVFGIGITQVPSCEIGATPSAFGDSYTGGGYSTFTDYNVGEFQLVVSTGQGGDEELTGSTVNTRTVGLQTPTATTRVDSWAAIVE